MPQNTTGLGLSGVVKWLLVIASLPMLVQAWQGIVERQTTGPGGGRTGGPLVTGSAAIGQGLLYLLYAILCLAAAWAVWFFWQRNED